ncbi:anti-phage ZorAB system protein ZorA [Inhella crocodyli]|uniref:MotA/TolQ/ExbB proton channel domain-containing protein n=1 Tax=Inhella crocodyli TaxID=2499851 RepID=A0A3S2XQW4_9BURK|nr:anti-phage ZorAB system protein ZorA [Inhella crocodyli]RVT82459.1 hypothetical protein EOD73_17145 [Inhella crocodyli]
MLENKEVLSTVVHWGVGGMLTLAAVFFLWQFLLPAWRARRELALAITRLETLKKSGPVLDLDQVEREVMVSEELRHCWSEFRDTLHPQKTANALGMLEVARWRQTAMASSFFTEQALVDSPLRTEFYKHLPGILTGVGIIGTFGGLILGLIGFQVSDDATVVRKSLQDLLTSVGSAFLVSGSAIALAMVITMIEKAMINGRYTQVERLCGVIDSLFDAGAGEEYLQRLVEASETSATQALQMKESLVTDLKQVLTELTQQQIATMNTTSNQLGTSITASLSEGLKEPLARISEAVQGVSGNQQEAVNKLLTDVLAGFTAQMESMFGQQMRGVNEMLVQTAATISQASQRFEALAGQIQQAGTGAVEGMAKRLDESLLQMQARQAEANEQMRAFIEQIKASSQQSQAESADLTMGMMRELSESTAALIKGLQEQAQAQGDAQQQRQAAMAQQASELLSGQAKAMDRMMGASETAAATMRNSVDAMKRSTDESIAQLAAATEAAAAAMRNAIESLKRGTHDNIERMGMGAERLFQASDTLGARLVDMRSASAEVADSMSSLNSATTSLNQALSATQLALGDHRAVRDALVTMVRDLRETVEAAKREGAMTSQLVSQLRLAADQLQRGTQESESYLKSVSGVLAEAHGEFAKHMEATLREGNKTFHQELAQATGLLKGAIQDLGDVLDTLPQGS